MDDTRFDSKLIADMGGLAFQIQRVSDTAKGFAVRVGGVQNAVWEDNEKDFLALYERIKKTIAFLEAVDPKSINGKEEVEILTPNSSMS